MNALKFIIKNQKAVENMAKKQISSRFGLNAIMSYQDIVNELYVKALEGKISIDEGNPYTTIFYHIQNITRKEVRRLKKLSPLWNMEEIEIQDEYTYTYYSEKAKRTYTKKVTYTRTEKEITSMKTFSNRADVQTILKRAISSNFAESVNFLLDIENMFDELEMKVFSMMRNEMKKKDIDNAMGQRCDRIYKRIEKKIEEYINA